MHRFSLPLANGGTVSGLVNLVEAGPATSQYRPLMVGLHGGSYSGEYFDVDDKHTAALASTGLGVPFVAIDRPGYGDSTPFSPIPKRSSNHEMGADWLHNLALPAVWATYGEPQGCNSVVLLCHSLGSPVAIMAAAKLASEEEQAANGNTDGPGHKPPRYPLAGIAMSGFGSVDETKRQADTVAALPEVFKYPNEVKNDMLIPDGTCDPAVYAHTDRLNCAFPSREILDIWDVWMPRFRGEWAAQVRVPVLVAIAERDVFWKGTAEAARDFASAFTGSKRVESALVRGAPHNLEMSYWAQAWYGRCFGFALECAVEYALLA
ncbi:Alpha/Beta hydrolase protein [Lasiosphaeria ovina]|uniref:Alpha/Beta hydrolase protein n=1 Tax=Lasiosphaeria ovina TaxID=92902 RepID=A0AAE0N9V7_9PEZI|nr:Alpha/Beta hydrolase protein [Lasiosphaeria ovina]